MNRLVIELLNLERGKAYGFQEYICNLLNYFYYHRNDINYGRIIIWCKDTEKNFFNQYEDRFEVKGYKYSSYLGRHWLQTTLPFKNKLNKNDLIFSPGNITGVVKRCRIVLTIHDLLFKRKDWLPNKLIRLQREFLVPISIKNADLIVAISKFTKEDIENYYPNAKGKIEVIYNSFNFSKYDGGTATDNVGGYFLSISMNADYKNQKSVLKAFRIYRESGGDKQLVIVGRMNPDSEASREYSRLPQIVKEHIEWKSNISNKELGSIYKGASCFISASKFEGLGMPVVEAMSFDLPVLLSDIPPHREVSMNKAIYFNPSDVEEIAQKMLAMDFVRRGYKDDVREMFSEEKTSAAYIRVFNSLASSNPGID